MHSNYNYDINNFYDASFEKSLSIFPENFNLLGGNNNSSSSNLSNGRTLDIAADPSQLNPDDRNVVPPPKITQEVPTREYKDRYMYVTKNIPTSREKRIELLVPTDIQIQTQYSDVYKTNVFYANSVRVRPVNQPYKGIEYIYANNYEPVLLYELTKEEVETAKRDKKINKRKLVSSRVLHSFRDITFEDGEKLPQIQGKLEYDYIEQQIYYSGDNRRLIISPGDNRKAPGYRKPYKSAAGWEYKNPKPSQETTNTIHDFDKVLAVPSEESLDINYFNLSEDNNNSSSRNLSNKRPLDVMTKDSSQMNPDDKDVLPPSQKKQKIQTREYQDRYMYVTKNMPALREERIALLVPDGIPVREKNGAFYANNKPVKPVNQPYRNIKFVYENNYEPVLFNELTEKEAETVKKNKMLDGRKIFTFNVLYQRRDIRFIDGEDIPKKGTNLEFDYIEQQIYYPGDNRPLIISKKNTRKTSIVADYGYKEPESFQNTTDTPSSHPNQNTVTEQNSGNASPAAIAAERMLTSPNTTGTPPNHNAASQNLELFQNTANVTLPHPNSTQVNAQNFNTTPSVIFMPGMMLASAHISLMIKIHLNAFMIKQIQHYLSEIEEMCQPPITTFSQASQNPESFQNATSMTLPHPNSNEVNAQNFNTTPSVISIQGMMFVSAHTSLLANLSLNAFMIKQIQRYLSEIEAMCESPITNFYQPSQNAGSPLFFTANLPPQPIASHDPIDARSLTFNMEKTMNPNK